MRPMPGLMPFMLPRSQPEQKLRMRLHLLIQRLPLRIRSQQEIHLWHVHDAVS